MRIILDRSLFDVQSTAEAAALVDLLGTAVRDPHAHALLTHPVYLPGGDNREIDAWLAQRPQFEGDAFRTVLVAGILTAAMQRSAPRSGPRLPAGLGDRLGAALRDDASPPRWIADLPAEYDRRPPHLALPAPPDPDQPPRLDFVQSLFDRM